MSVVVKIGTGVVVESTDFNVWTEAQKAIDVLRPTGSGVRFTVSECDEVIRQIFKNDFTTNVGFFMAWYDRKPEFADKKIQAHPYKNGFLVFWGCTPNNVKKNFQTCMYAANKAPVRWSIYSTMRHVQYLVEPKPYTI